MVLIVFTEGPYVLGVSAKAEVCSQQRCSGNGWCTPVVAGATDGIHTAYESG